MTTTEPRILIVDDHLDLAEALARQLEMHGRSAVAVESVRDALDLLDDDPSIGLVVTDVRMPGVDGLDFRRVLKHRFPALPVIFMTGMPVDKDDLIPEHVEVLQKPIPVAVLLAAISRSQRAQ